MEFVTFGSPKNPAMLLVHPSHCTGQCFAVLAPHLEDYYLICPTLDGHNLGDNTSYAGSGPAADEVAHYLTAHGITRLEVVLGLSLGCYTAYQLYRRGTFWVGHLFLDGAPFRPVGPLARRVVLWGQKRQRNRLQKNPDHKLALDKLYPQLAPAMRQLAAHYSDETLERIVAEIGSPLDPAAKGADITFLYGQQDPYRRAVAHIKKAGYQSRILIQPGLGHAEWILRAPDQYARLLKGKGL